MRAKIDPQRSIFELYGEHTMSQDLKAISNRLDLHPEFLDWVAIDLNCQHQTQTGRQGLTVENVLRTAIYHNYWQVTYRQLEFMIGLGGGHFNYRQCLNQQGIHRQRHAADIEILQ